MNRSLVHGLHATRLVLVALLIVIECFARDWGPVRAEPISIEPAVVIAAYACNTGTTSGMTFTYTDIHRWNDPIVAVSNLTGVPANVIKGIMWVESRGMLNARSPLTSSGYYFGLMQIGATSAVPEYMKSVSWMCGNAYNQILAGATELINKSNVIGSTDWVKVAGAYFGYGTDVNGTTTNSYMQQFANHTKAMVGTSPGAVDWTAATSPTPTPLPWLGYTTGTTITVDTARLNMRSGAGTSYSVIRVLTSGQELIVLSGPAKIGSNYWYQIQLPDGSIGWIAGNYTQGPPPSPTTSPTATSTPTMTTTSTVTPTLGATTPTTTATDTPTPTETTVSDTGDTYKTTTRLNLRKTPSTSGSILVTLASGTTVRLLGESQQANGYLWQRIQTDSRTGWVAMRYLQAIDIPSPSLTPTRTSVPDTDIQGPIFSIGDTVAVRSGSLNSRTAPGTKSPILGTLRTGTRGIVIDGPESNSGHSWYRLQVAGHPDGWVAGAYLTLVSAVDTSTPNPTETPTLEPTAIPTITPTLESPTDTPTNMPAETVIIETPTSESPVMEPTLEQPATEQLTEIPALDTDQDGIEDNLDSCMDQPNLGIDSDGDGIDDACDLPEDQNSEIDVESAIESSPVVD